MSAPSVEVMTRVGVSTFARAHMDMFTHDVLTVTWADDEREAKTYRRGEWRQAIMRDARGYIVALHTAETPIIVWGS